MVDATHTSFNASDRSYYAILKKEVHNKAVLAEFEPKRIAELDIVVAEMTSNLHKYAIGGEMLIGRFVEGDNEYIEIICIDDGPGMTEPIKMMKDGFSSTNTMGHGLGSIKRLSDKFDIYSLKNWGTIVLSRIYKKELKRSKDKSAVEIRQLVVNKPGEITSGDGCYYKFTDQYLKLILADGLGHGPDANYATNEAVNAFKLCPYNSPVEIIRYLHTSIRKTRGAVATVIVFDFERKTFNIAGVGNIATRLWGVGNTKSPLAYNGIVGHAIPNTMNDQYMSLTEYQQVILCSDGIRSRWDLSKYPGLHKHDLSVQAAVIYKDFARRNDDMSVVIGKFNLK